VRTWDPVISAAFPWGWWGSSQLIVVWHNFWRIKVKLSLYSSGPQPLRDCGPVSSFLFIRRGPSPNRFTRKHLPSFVKVHALS
jgi:hypothetical protein